MKIGRRASQRLRRCPGLKGVLTCSPARSSCSTGLPAPARPPCSRRSRRPCRSPSWMPGWTASYGCCPSATWSSPCGTTCWAERCPLPVGRGGRRRWAAVGGRHAPGDRRALPVRQPRAGRSCAGRTGLAAGVHRLVQRSARVFRRRALPPRRVGAARAGAAGSDAGAGEGAV